MYPWDQLGIEPTNSKKVVKIAYAALLKKHRPDNDPEGFQQVNQAYRTALRLIEDSKEKPVIDKSSQIEAANFVSKDSPSESSYPKEKVTELSDQFSQDILTQFEQMALVELKQQANADNWVFLEKYHSIEDFQIREALSLELFKRVGDYNRQSIKQNRTLMFGQFAIETIAHYLDWEENWQILQESFPDHHVEQVFKFLSHKQQNVDVKQLLLRTVSVALDMLLAFGITYLISLRPWASEQESVEPFTIVVYMILNLSTIDISNSLSLLQFFLGFKAYDKNLIVINSKTAVKRAITFHLVMTPCYFIFYDYAAFSDLMLPVIGVLAVVNLLVWIWRKQLIHDWFSGSFVLK